MKSESITDNFKARFNGLFSQDYMAAFAASFIFFFPSVRQNLITESLDLDEMIAWRWLNDSWTDLWRHLLIDAQGPVYCLFAKLIHTLFPLENDYWVRAPSLAIATAIFFFWSYRWSQRSAGRLVILILLVLLLGFNPLFRFVAAYARYSVLIFALCSYLTVRISDQLEQGKTIAINAWDALAIGTLACTHFLGVLWLATCWLTMLVMRVKIRLGKNAALKLGFILASVALLSFFFFQQLSTGKDMSWSMATHEDVTTLLRVVFGHSYPVWILMILAQIMVLRGRLSFTYKFFLLQIGFILMANCFGFFFQVNLFITRYLVVFTPMILILLEETFTWFNGLMITNKLGQNLLQLTVILLTLDMGTQHFIGRSGPKQILYRLKHDIAYSKNDDLKRVGCVIDRDFFHIMAIYSHQYFKKDVCSAYWDNFSQPDLEKMRYLLVFDSKGGVVPPPLSHSWIKREESGDHGWMLFEKAEL